jgi:ArsR family transcriptional regulator
MYANVGGLQVQPVMQLCRALGDETPRLSPAHDGEACHVEAALDLSQPNASRHLSLLRTAGVVEPRRDGNWIYYRLANQTDPERRKVLAAIVRNFDAHDQLKKDVERLRKTKGPSACK